MKIVLIGSSSFLAQSIMKLNSNHEIIEIGRKTKTPFNFPNQTIDTIDLNLLLSSDLVVYCAGAGIQPGHQDTESIIHQLNYKQPKLLIDTLADANYDGQLITFGSYFEIGSSNRQKPYNEIELIQSTNPLPNAYCESKKKLTTEIHENHNKYTLNHLHLILTNIYGVGENENRLLPYLARSFKAGQEVSLTSGQQIRQFTHVDDVSRLILGSETRNLSGILNFTNPQEISVKAVVEQMAELYTVSSQKLKFKAVDKRDSGMSYLGLDTRLLRQKVSNFSFLPLKEGLMTYIDKA